MFLLVMMLCALTATAQGVISDFQQFRQQVLSDYQGFRKSVLDNYADFLDTVWKDYKSFRGVMRDDIPKPMLPPDVRKEPNGKPSGAKPVVTVPKPVQPVKPTMPKEPHAPAPSVVPAAPLNPQAMPSVTFPFYGFSLKAPQMQCLSLHDTKPHSVAAAWKGYEGKGMKAIAKSLYANAQAMGLNDWFTYEMIRMCVDSQCKQMAANDRVVLKHFLLANMGYDVRLALQGDEFVLLIGIDGQVYARRFTNVDGRRYYMFTDVGGDDTGSDYFSTCKLPSDVDMGNRLDMRICHELKVSSSEKRPVRVSWGEMEVTCEIDEKEMEMLRHYPQMDIPLYAQSVVNSSLRESLLKQIKPYIAGLSQRDAANKLLHFVQLAFAYATDGQQHGYEKTYFLEENFYYPKNDCEDRAIFYAFLVRNLLGLDVHLVQFPGHECTAVHFTDSSIGGDGYMYEGRTFVICDPTYIGASIGQCMPNYSDKAPKVQLW